MNTFSSLCDGLAGIMTAPADVEHSNGPDPALWGGAGRFVACDRTATLVREQLVMAPLSESPVARDLTNRGPIRPKCLSGAVAGV